MLKNFVIEINLRVSGNSVFTQNYKERTKPQFLNYQSTTRILIGFFKESSAYAVYLNLEPKLINLKNLKHIAH